MPTYEYECPAHGEFEEYHSISIKLEHCPKCQEEGKVQEIKRLISGGSGKGQMILTDDEFKASLKGETDKLKKEMQGSAKVYANMLGEDKYHKMQTQMDRRKRS